MSKVIVSDIDGVLANFNLAYGDLFVEISGEDRFTKGWREDLQHGGTNFPTTWSWEKAAGYSKAIEDEVWKDHILESSTRFWQELEPLPYAKESLMMLNRRQKAGDMVWFVSTRMGSKAHLQTLNWLYEQGMDYPCLFFADDKIPYLRLLKPSFFIDDKPSTVLEVARVSGQEKWQDFQLVLRDAPYNREVQGVSRATNIKDALEQAGLWQK